MALNKRLIRIFRENKGRYIGIFILIFLGSFMFVFAKGLGDNLDRFVSGFADNNLQEDVSFSTDVPLNNIAEIELDSGAVIDTYRYFDEPIPDAPLRLLSQSAKVNLPSVKSGRLIESAGEILLDPFYASKHNILQGDKIMAGGKAFTVVGTVALPHYVYALKNINDVLPPAGFGIGLISSEAMDSFPAAVTVYSARFNERGNMNAQTAKLHGLLSETGHSLSDWVDAKTNKRIQMPWASITGVKTMSVPIPFFMFLMCCLIISVMIRRMVHMDAAVIGMLYAQGYRKKELTRHYIMIPLSLAFLGGLLGAALAMPMIRPTIAMFIDTYYNVPDAGIEISLVNAAIGIIMPVVLLGVSCFLAIRKEMQKSAAELIKGDDKKAKISFIERRIKLDNLKFIAKFQMRENLRSIPRLLFLVFGVCTASMMLMFGFTINNSMNAIFSSAPDSMYNFRYEYSFKQVRRGNVPDSSEPFNAIRCYQYGNEAAEFYVMGVLPDSKSLKLQTADGKELPTDRVSISYPLSSRLKLHVGDSIKFINKLDGKNYQLKIEGIAKTYSGQFIYMPLEAFNSMTGQEQGSYSGLFSSRELPLDDALLSGVKDMQQVSNSMDDLAGTMISTVVFITVFAGLMGVIIIFLVTSLIIEESKTAISLFKIFGYRKKEIQRLVLNSSTLLVMLGFLLGFPLMLVSANAMYGYLGNMINMVLPMIVNPVHVLVSFILVLLSYELTKALCSKKLERITMQEALKAGNE